MIDYDTDLTDALELIRKLVESNRRVLKDPAPLIQAVSLADSAIQISIQPWVAVADYGAIVGELNVAVVEELRRRGIGIPYPRREIRMVNAA